MEPITSPRNQRIRNAARLRLRRQRDKQRRILIDGIRETLRALDAGVKILDVFYHLGDQPNAEITTGLQQLEAAGCELSPVTSEVFPHVAFGDRATGVVAIAEPPRRQLSDIQLGDSPLILIAENLEKPGNLGAILRTADAAGVTAVVTCGGVELYNPNTIRASLGAVFTVQVCSASDEETRTWLHDAGVQIFAAIVEGSTLYTSQRYDVAAAFVLGSEAKGLSSVWRQKDVTAVRLPMLGFVDSLNVSTTAAILAYEAIRQRQAPT